MCLCCTFIVIALDIQWLSKLTCSGNILMLQFDYLIYSLARRILIFSLIAQPLFLTGSSNLWKNPIFRNSLRLGGGVPNMFELPSRLFRCMASSGSGNDDFAQPTSTEEIVAPLPLYSWPDKKVN